MPEKRAAGKWVVEQGSAEYLPDCVEAYKYSELGEIHYHTDEELAALFRDGFAKGEMYLAMGEDSNCAGFAWIGLNGAFCSFPYCRILAVKKEFRGQGAGTALLQHFEELGFAKSRRLFILVSDFNGGAKRLYERLGYVDVGFVPDLFRAGVGEFVLAKYKPE